MQLPSHSTQMCCPILSSPTLRLISCFPPHHCTCRHEMKSFRMLCEPLPSELKEATSHTSLQAVVLTLSLGTGNFRPTWCWMCLHCSKSMKDKVGHPKFKAPACWAGRTCLVDLRGMIDVHLYSISQLLQRKPGRLKTSHKNMSYTKPANHLILTHWDCYK